MNTDETRIGTIHNLVSDPCFIRVHPWLTLESSDAHPPRVPALVVAAGPGPDGAAVRRPHRPGGPGRGCPGPRRRPTRRRERRPEHRRPARRPGLREAPADPEARPTGPRPTDGRDRPAPGPQAARQAPPGRPPGGDPRRRVPEPEP